MKYLIIILVMTTIATNTYAVTSIFPEDFKGKNCEEALKIAKSGCRTGFEGGNIPSLESRCVVQTMAMYFRPGANWQQEKVLSVTTVDDLDEVYLVAECTELKSK